MAAAATTLDRRGRQGCSRCNMYTVYTYCRHTHTRLGMTPSTSSSPVLRPLLLLPQPLSPHNLAKRQARTRLFRTVRKLVTTVQAVLALAPVSCSDCLRKALQRAQLWVCCAWIPEETLCAGWQPVCCLEPATLVTDKLHIISAESQHICSRVCTLPVSDWQ